MASLRGNGCDETGKLRRDQPSIFAPTGHSAKNDSMRLSDSFRAFARFPWASSFQPEAVGLPYNADRRLAALQLQSSRFG